MNDNIDITINDKSLSIECDYAKQISGKSKRNLISLLESKLNKSNLLKATKISIDKNSIKILNKNNETIKHIKGTEVDKIFKSIHKNGNWEPVWGEKDPGRKKTDKKVFAQLHVNHRVKNTEYEGNVASKNAKEMRSVLKSLLKENPLSREDSEIIKATLKMLKDRVALEKEIDSLIFSSPQRMYKHIAAKLEEGPIYLPSGWTSTGKGSGHAAIVKFFKEGNNICYYIINKGAGIQNHPVIESKAMGKTKHDIRSQKYVMGEKEFFGQKGLELITALHAMKRSQKGFVNFISDPLSKLFNKFIKLFKPLHQYQDSHYLEYNGEDLYAACSLFADEIEENEPKSEFASTSQISGVCTQSSLNASLLDQFLTSAELTRENADRMMFLIKQKSFENACQDWMDGIDKNPEERMLLKEAAKQHLIRIQKLEDEKIDDSIKYGKELALNVLNKIEEIEKKKELSPLPFTNDIKIDKQPANPLPPIASNGIEIKHREADYFSLIGQIQGKPQKLEDAVKQLDLAVRLAEVELEKKSDPIKLFTELTRIIELLPLSHENFWNGLSQNEAKNVLHNLEKLTEQILISSQKILVQQKGAKKGVLDKEKINEAMAIAYDIGVAVGDQIDELKIADFRIDGPRSPEKSYHQIRTQNKTAQVAQNFESRNNKLDSQQQKGKLFKNYFEEGGTQYHWMGILFGKDNLENMRKRDIDPWAGDLGRAYANTYIEAEKIIAERIPAYSNLLKLAKRAKGVKRNNIENLLTSNLSQYHQTKKGARILLIPNKNKAGSQSFLLNPEKPIKADSESIKLDPITVDNFENALLLKSPKQNQVTNLDDRYIGELALFENFPETAPNQILSWANNNLTLVSHPFVQHKISKNLFTPPQLNNLLKDPVNGVLTQKLIRNFVVNAMNHYEHSESLETYLWILSIAEALALHQYECGIKEGIILVDEKVKALVDHAHIKGKNLSIAEKNEIAAHYLGLFVELAPKKEDASSFLKAFFLFSHEPSNAIKESHFNANKALLANIDAMWEKFGELAQEDKDKTAREILASLDIAADENLSCNFNEQGITYGAYRLALNGRVYKQGVEIQSLPPHLQAAGLCKEYLETNRLGPVNVSEGYYLQHDGELRFLPSRDNLYLQAIEKKIKLKEGDESWCRYQTKNQCEELIKKYPHLPPSLFRPPNQVFIEVNKKSPRIISLEPNGTQYVAQIKAGTLHTHTDFAGSEISMAPLKAISTASPMRQWLEKIESPDHIVLGFNENNKETVQIHFSRLGLHFERNEDNKLACRELEGFFLKDPQDLPFDHYKGCIVIENANGQTKTIVPFHPFQDGSKKSCAMSQEIKVDLEKVGKIPYFIYKNGSRGNLIAETHKPQAALYLAVLFRTEKNYEKGLEQIKQSETYAGNNEIDYEIAELLTKQPDNSPEGTAFDLQFYYRLKNHAQKPSSPSNKILQENQKKIDEKIPKLGSAYYNVISGKREDIYAIPQSLRLKKEQKELLGIYRENAPDVSRYQTAPSFSYLTDQSPNPNPLLENEEAKASYDLLKDIDEKEINQHVEKIKEIVGEQANLKNKANVKTIKDDLKKTFKNEVAGMIIKTITASPINSDEEYQSTLTKIRNHILITELCPLLIAPIQIPLLGPLIHSESRTPPAPAFDPRKLRPAALSKGKAPLTPIDCYLKEHYNTILEHLSQPEKKEHILRHLLYISRYAKRGGSDLRLTNLLELLLFASNLESEELKTILKEKKAIPRLAALAGKFVEFKDDENHKKKTELDVSKFRIKADQKTIKAEKKGSIADRKPFEKIPIQEQAFKRIVNKIGKGEDLIGPMKGFYTKFEFKENKEKIQYPERLFDEEHINKASEGAKKQLIELNNALSELKKEEGRPSFSSAKHINEMRREIEAAKIESKIKMEKNREWALDLANEMKDSKNLELRGGGLLKMLTLGDITAAYLRQDGGKLKQENPELTQKNIEIIFRLLMEGDLAAAQEKQCGEMLAIISSDRSENEKKHLLGEIANRNFKSEFLAKYPQFSVFAAETGLWPRPDQIEVIDWALEKLETGKISEEAAAKILERSAGFGKSKVFTAIVAQIAAQRGQLVKIVNIANLFDFGKEDISSSLKEAFGQNLEVIDWSVGKVQVTKEKLDSLYGQMKIWQNEGHVILIKPETWGLINIAKKKGAALKDHELEEAAKKVLGLFSRGLTLIDEAHLSMNPLTEINQAFGNPSTIPKEQFNELVANYEILLKDENLGIKNNSQSVANPDEATHTLIDDIANRNIYKEKNIEPEKLKQWLALPLGHDLPDWLKLVLEKDEQFFNLIEIQHQFVQNLFPHLMRQRGKIDYGKHPEEKNFFAAPRHDTRETTASFSNEIITASLSCQMIAQEGISFSAFKTVLNQWLRAHEEESKYASPTPTEEFLRTLSGEFYSLNNLTAEGRQSRKLYEKLKNHPKFHNYYLKNFVHPQIVVYKEKISSTPAEFLSGLGISLLLTATPGSKASYPLLAESAEDHKEDTKAVAHDIAQMLDPRNEKVIEIGPINKPKDFFDQAGKEIDLDDVQFIIDRGGNFRNVDDNREVLKGLQENRIENNGKIRSGVAVATTEEGRNAHFVEYDKKGNIIITVLPGSELEKAMSKARNDPEKLKEAVHFFSIQENTGTDWKLPDKCKGIFTMGERVTRSNAVQGIKRDRKLDRKDHSYTWVIPKTVAGTIRKEGDIPTPQEILIWLTENEVEEESKKIGMRFVQGVDEILLAHKPGEGGIENALNISAANPAPAEYYREKVELDKYEDRYVGLIVQKLKIIYPENKSLSSEIKKITDLKGKGILQDNEVEKFASLIKKTKEALGRDKEIDFQQKDLNAAQEVEAVKEQEAEEVKQQEAQEENEALVKNRSKVVPKSENYNGYELGNIDFTNNNKWGTVSATYKWPKNLKGPKLHISKPFFDIEDKHTEDLLRPALSMLVIINETAEGEKYEYVPLSQNGTRFYQKQLTEPEQIQGKKFAIVSANGDLLFMQKANALTPEEQNTLAQAETFKQALTLMALTRGDIKGDPDTLKSVFGNCTEEDFQTIKTNLQKALLGPGIKFENVRYVNMRKALKEEGEKELKVKEPQQPIQEAKSVDLDKQKEIAALPENFKKVEEQAAQRLRPIQGKKGFAAFLNWLKNIFKTS